MQTQPARLLHPVPIPNQKGHTVIQPAHESPKPGPGPYRAASQQDDLTVLQLEVAKWRVIAFHGIPYEHHHHISGNTAQEVEDRAHLLAGLLNLIPTKN
jgi:hypothetical protein